MHPANTIALINASPLPATDTASGAPIAYQPNYQGIAIRAAPPPAWLNIAPKVVNKVARKRGVLQTPPILPAQITKEHAAIAAVVSAPLPPLQLPNSLQTLLANGEWGNALIGLVQDVRTPIAITTDSIDSIFAWDESVAGVRGNAACRNSYVQAIMDLLHLQSGVGLFRDVIIAHHCMPGLPKVNFKLVQRAGSRFQWFDYPKKCQINLEWDGANNLHRSDTWVLIAKNTHLPVAGDPNSQLDFIPVAVPPQVVFAHELGHYLNELIAYKKHIEITHPDIVAAAIVPEKGDYGPLTIIQHNAKAIISQSTLIEIQECGKDVLVGIIPPDQPRSTLDPAEVSLADLWGISKYEERLNILPSSNILQNGGSGYSDSAIIGEAVLAGIITIAPIGGHAVNIAGLSKECFVRFSHQDFIGFRKIFDPLSANATHLAKFKDLVAALLNKIDRNGRQPGVAFQALTVNDLPRIN
jgi:hypothetical protein